MFGHIPVTVDGSATPDLVLEQAIRLAKEQRSELRVVHVVDLTTLNWPEGGDFDDIYKRFRKAGQQVWRRRAATARRLIDKHHTAAIVIVRLLSTGCAPSARWSLA